MRRLLFGAMLVGCGMSTKTTEALPDPLPPDSAPQVKASPVFAAVGDLDGDGKLDLLVANYGANTISIFQNTTTAGSMEVAFAPGIDLVAGGGPHSIAVADLNGDGKLDFAVANIDARTVSVFLNTTANGATTPSFAARADITTGALADTNVVIGDFDGDGKPDLAVANASSSVISILTNTTTVGAMTPSFTPKLDLKVASNTQSMVSADFNGDGLPDLAICSLDGVAGGSLVVLLDTTAPGGPIAFGSALELPVTAGDYPLKLATGDFNGDNKPDLAAGTFTYGGSLATTPVSIFLDTSTQATASFAARVDLMVTGQQPSVAVADFNGDGKPDLSVASVRFAAPTILLDMTAVDAQSPTFGPEQAMTSGSSAVSITVGDFNSDGRPDVVVVSTDANTVSVVLDATPSGAAALEFTPEVVLGTGP